MGIEVRSAKLNRTPIKYLKIIFFPLPTPHSIPHKLFKIFPIWGGTSWGANPWSILPSIMERLCWNPLFFILRFCPSYLSLISSIKGETGSARILKSFVEFNGIIFYGGKSSHKLIIYKLSFLFLKLAVILILF